MDKLHSEQVDTLFKAILSLKSIDECYDFFEDACTIKEIIEIASRFNIAGLLKDGKSYTEIAEQTGVSTATICRVNRCLNYGSDGYKTALERVAKGDNK